jgi:hypothetical protein
MQLPIAGQDKGTEVSPVDLAGNGDAGGDGQAVAQRPGIGLDAR